MIEYFRNIQIETLIIKKQKTYVTIIQTLKKYRYVINTKLYL